MKYQIDKLNLSANWSIVNGTLTDIEYDKFDRYAFQGQVQVDFLDNGIMTFIPLSPIDVTGSDTFYITVNYNNLSTYPSDSLFIKFYSGVNSVEYFLTITSDKPDEYLFYNPYTTIDKVEIRTLTACTLVLNDLVACKDELPYDINIGIGEYVETLVPTSILLGTSTVISGSKTLTVNQVPKFAERQSCIRIGSEVHQVLGHTINKDNTVSYQFGQMFDGATILNNWTNENVYLEIPILVNPKQREGVTPALSIEGGFDATTILSQTFKRCDLICIDNSSPKNYYYRTFSGQYLFKPMLHGLYRSLETKELIARIFQSVAGNNEYMFWNGRRYVIYTARNQKQDSDFGDETGELGLTLEVETGVYEWQIKTVKNNLQTTITTQIQ